MDLANCIREELYHTMPKSETEITLSINLIENLSTDGKRTLLLISQITSDNKKVFISGLTNYEKKYQERKISYLQYVDSTGFLTPRNLQKHITRAMINAFYKCCLKSDLLVIYASSMPSLLFSNSQFNNLKRQLSDLELIKWWFAIIKNWDLKECHFHAPNSDGLPYYESVMKSKPETFHLGYPFNEKLAFKNAFTTFDNFGIECPFKMHLDKVGHLATLKSFFSTFGLNGKLCCFFFIEPSNNEDKENMNANSVDNKRLLYELEEWDSILVFLLDELDFSSLAKGIESTEQFYSKFEMKNEVTVKVKGNAMNADKPLEENAKKVQTLIPKRKSKVAEGSNKRPNV